MKVLKTGGLRTPHGQACGCSEPTLVHTREQNNPCLVPVSHQMAHLFRLAARQDAGLLVPTDQRPTSTRASWRASATASPAEDEMLISRHSCHPRLVARPVRTSSAEKSGPSRDHGTKPGPPGSRRVLKAAAFDCGSALEPELGLPSVPERI